MKKSRAGCPSWCDGAKDPLVHNSAPTHVGKTVHAGAASAIISQQVEHDPELGEGARFEALASLWYGGYGAVGDLAAVDCRDIAAVMEQVADQLDDVARGAGVVYGENRP